MSTPKPIPAMREHSVNPTTDRCVMCGRNRFNRERTPNCDVKWHSATPERVLEAPAAPTTILPRESPEAETLGIGGSHGSRAPASTTAPASTPGLSAEREREIQVLAHEILVAMFDTGYIMGVGSDPRGAKEKAIAAITDRLRDQLADGWPCKRCGGHGGHEENCEGSAPSHPAPGGSHE